MRAWLASIRGRVVTESLETRSARVRAAGGKAFVPYATGGLRRGRRGAAAGSRPPARDAIEVGIPFSDPVMDGR